MKTSTLFALGLFPPTTGCIIPFAIAPVPSVASGQKVTFSDRDGRLIEKDGLLIVSRRKHWTGGFPFGDTPRFNRVVEIRGGKARLPSDWAPALFFLVPIPFYPVTSKPMLGVLPAEEVELVPLISGYFDRTSWSSLLPFAPFIGDDCSDYSKIRQGSIRLEEACKSLADMETCEFFWQNIRGQLRSPQEPKKDECALNLRILRQSEYTRIRRHIEQELERISAETGRLETIEAAAAPDNKN